MAATLVVMDAKGEYIVANDALIIAVATTKISRRIKNAYAMHNPEVVKDYLRIRLGHLGREVFTTIFLNTKHHVIECEDMFKGTISSCEVHPREIMRRALMLNSAAIIISHNHPSGDPTPSQADRHLTTKIVEAGALVGVRVLDHIVIGGNSTFSFAEQGLLY